MGRETRGTIESKCRWLRRAALAIRVAVGLLTLACALLAGGLAANALGKDSPWVWTIALLAALAAGVFLMGNPNLHGIADRIERTAQERENASGGPAPPPAH